MQCIKTTKKGEQCKKRSWWEGGYCYRHLPDLSFDEWLLILAREAEKENLPSRIEILPAFLLCNRWAPFSPEQILKTWVHKLPPRYSPTCWMEGPAQILLVLGVEYRSFTKHASTFRSRDTDIKSFILPENAVVAVDQMLEVIDTPAATLISTQVQACVERCKVQTKIIEGESDTGWKEYIQGNMRNHLRQSSKALECFPCHQNE